MAPVPPHKRGSAPADLRLHIITSLRANDPNDQGGDPGLRLCDFGRETTLCAKGRSKIDGVMGLGGFAFAVFRAREQAADIGAMADEDHNRQDDGQR